MQVILSNLLNSENIIIIEISSTYYAKINYRAEEFNDLLQFNVHKHVMPHNHKHIYYNHIHISHNHVHILYNHININYYRL